MGKILTIGIPTYNRLWKLKETIQEFLKYPYEDVELMLSDASTDDETKCYVERLTDPRIKYIRREKEPVEEFIKNSDAEYVLYMFDKDTFEAEALIHFTDFLRENNKIAYGRCRLRFDKRIDSGKFISYRKGFEGLHALAYQDWHPSGFFFKVDVGKNIVNKLLSVHGSCWYAEFAMRGEGAYYQNRFIVVESPQDASRGKTIMSSGKKLEDMLFSPKARMDVMLEFWEHLYQLQLKREDKRTLALDVFKRQLESATLGYRYIMNNLQLCKHYGVRRKQITDVELLQITFRFTLKAVREIFYRKDVSLKDKLGLSCRILCAMLCNLGKIRD